MGGEAGLGLSDPDAAGRTAGLGLNEAVLSGKPMELGAGNKAGLGLIAAGATGADGFGDKFSIWETG